MNAPATHEFEATSVRLEREILRLNGLSVLGLLQAADPAEERALREAIHQIAMRRVCIGECA